MKDYQKSPPSFNANSGKSEEKITTKTYWRAGKVTIYMPPPQKLCRISPLRNPGGGVYRCFLRSWQFVHHPLKLPLVDWKPFVGVVHGWWFPNEIAPENVEFNTQNGTKNADKGPKKRPKMSRKLLKPFFSCCLKAFSPATNVSPPRICTSHRDDLQGWPQWKFEGVAGQGRSRDLGRGWSLTEIYPAQNWSSEMPKSLLPAQPQYWINSWTHGCKILIQCWAGVWHLHRQSTIPPSTCAG